MHLHLPLLLLQEVDLSPLEGNTHPAIIMLLGVCFVVISALFALFAWDWKRKTQRVDDLTTQVQQVSQAHATTVQTILVEHRRERDGQQERYAQISREFVQAVGDVSKWMEALPPNMERSHEKTRGEIIGAIRDQRGK